MGVSRVCRVRVVWYVLVSGDGLRRLLLLLLLGMSASRLYYQCAAFHDYTIHNVYTKKQKKRKNERITAL
jgi:hypothetical protein